MAVTALKVLRHPHIVRLKEVVRSEEGELFFVFELLEGNVYQLLSRDNKVLEWVVMVGEW